VVVVGPIAIACGGAATPQTGDDAGRSDAGAVYADY
jgi:hypothetical protein